MRVFTDLNQIDDMENCVIAFGNFDGVHKGHQELIRRAVNSAFVTNLKSVIFTFSNHPKNILAGKQIVKNIQTFEEKIESFKSLGINYVVAVPFDEKLRNMEPEDFIVDILVNKLNMKEAYCGFNYSFGKGGKGNPETLMKVAFTKGYGLHVVEPFMVEGEIVSSTLIRQYIENGNVGRCLPLMGRYYTVKGVVIKGNKVGRTLGFPTSNLTLDDEMVSPANGVYVTYCYLNGLRYASITNVGTKPTIGDFEARSIETHIFNFEEDIYGKEIKVAFLDRLRPEQKFENVEELRRQIKDDCLTAVNYHGIMNC